MNFKTLVFTTFVVLALINISLCEEENQNGTSKIVGGQIMEIEGAPYLVSLMYQGVHQCGGSIISNQWILSAAHCLVTTTPTDYKVRTGSSRKSRGGTIFDVEKIIPNPGYSSATSDKDFLLIKLKKTIPFNDRQQLIKLPSGGKQIADGTEVMTCGFGETQNEMESNEFLRAVIVKVTNQVTCNDAYENKISANMICAGTEEGGKDSCQGDSGGPLEQVNDGELVGVVSFGNICGDAAQPGVYSRVSQVRNWIKETSKV